MQLFLMVVSPEAHFFRVQAKRRLSSRRGFPGIPVLGVYGNGEFFAQELQSYAAVLTAILD